MSRLRTLFGKPSHSEGHRKINSDITAIDGICIAHKGDIINDDYLKNFKNINTHQVHFEKVSDSQLYGHLGLLLDSKKFSFITDAGSLKKEILDILGQLELKSSIIKEVNWMSRLFYHYHHCLSVVLIVTRIMMEFSKNQEQIKNASSGALTHDIGITRVPGNILQKISSLNSNELRIIREHPIYSYILLTYYYGDLYHPNAQVAYTHHEDLLGEGYPQGIVQNNFISRVIHISDMYDALISDRPFRPAVNSEKAMELIEASVEEKRVDRDIFSVLKNLLAI